MGIILEVGVETIRARNQELTRGIIERADDAKLELLSPREDEQRGGLVRLRIPGGRERAEHVLHRLFERDVVLDSRNDAVRISPHFFNNEQDLDRCFAELRALL
jgi:selenocysteine lyase/cysteine desulfurase